MADPDEQVEEGPNIEPHALMLGVKSKAVVRFSNVQVQAIFNRLACNTNLNLPPSNWLTTSIHSCGLHQAVYQTPGFASFRMAHMFPDCVGKVDVVSDAENIKTLLKLPYTSNGIISMTVHNVGNTLLIDEFDIQKYLLRRADDDWSWLRTLILEEILRCTEKDNNFCLKDKSRQAIQKKNLLSKFLYHSLKPSLTSDFTVQQVREALKIPPPLPITGPLLPEPKVEQNIPDPKTSHTFNRNVVWTFEDIRMLIGTDMPIFGGPNNPCISLRLNDKKQPINVLTGIDYWLDNLMCNVPEVMMCYHLDGIVKKYEVIKTEDLPFLEDSPFSPKVVRNVAQNILAFLKANATKEGHTYWLFKGRNDDVVKLYDLTTFCSEPTAPTRKPKNPNWNENWENPFTVPVAMLMYNVARNIKSTASRITPKIAGNIKALLENCIKLLPKEKYPQIVTSSHYILADLHIPAGIDPKAPRFDVCDADSDEQSLYDDDEEYDLLGISSDEEDDHRPYDNGNMENNVAVQKISDTLKELKLEEKRIMNKQRKPDPLMADTEERCRTSINNINAGISCLRYFSENQDKFIKESEARAKDEEKQRILHEEQNPNMAKPLKPIPLPYETLSSFRPGLDDISLEIKAKVEGHSLRQVQVQCTCKKSKRGKAKTPKTCKCETNPQAQQLQQLVASMFNSQQFGSWDVHLKLLLLEKACLTYAILGEYYYEAEKYGASLSAIYMSCRCQQVVIKHMSGIASQKSCLLGRAGDCFYQMAKAWENIDIYIDEFFADNDDEQHILKELDRDLMNDDESDLIAPRKHLEQLMITSCTCYENALNVTTEDNQNTRQELYRRLGNMYNELGLKYMFWAQGKIEGLQKAGELEGTEGTSGTEEDPVYQLAMQSYDCLLRGIEAFNKVNDIVNLAFLYCNVGRYMRFRAHLMPLDTDATSKESQKKFYNQAFTSYEKAKDLLGSRKSSPDLWDLVNWELSTATFTYAKQLQDFSTTDGSNVAELEKEVLLALQKALKLCDVEHAGSRQILYTYRSGLIHKRIASLHYSQVRNQGESTQIKKKTLQLCKFHYEKAATILGNLKEVSDLLVIQLERISLQEYLAEMYSGISQKIKNVETGLDLCLSCQPLFEQVVAIHNSDSNTPDAIYGEFFKHMRLFVTRLQNALKTLTKLLMSTKDPKHNTTLYRNMYLQSLKGCPGADDALIKVEQLAKQIFSLLSSLNEMKSQHLPSSLGNGKHK